MDTHPDLYLQITYLRIIREAKETSNGKIIYQPCSLYGNLQIRCIDLTTFLHTEYVPLNQTFTIDDFGCNDLVDLSNPKIEVYQKKEESAKIQYTKNRTAI